MKNTKRFVVVGIAVLVLLGGTVAAFAASQYATPAEAVAGLTGREVQSVIDERVQTGKTYGNMAKDAGVLEQFKAEMLEMKKDILEARVAAGKMTQEQADAIIDKIISNQAVCDGNGPGGKCGLHGAGFGNSAGFGRGAQCDEPGCPACGLDGRGRGQGGQGDQKSEQNGLGHGHAHTPVHGHRQDGQNHGQDNHAQGAHLRDGSCVK